MSSTPSRATLRGTQLVQLIQVRYICLCATISAITYGCHCVTQCKSLWKRQSVLFNLVRPLKHVFSVITERWVTATRFTHQPSVRCLPRTGSAYFCRTVYSIYLRPTDIYGMTHSWGTRLVQHIVEDITSLKGRTQNSIWQYIHTALLSLVIKVFFFLL